MPISQVQLRLSGRPTPQNGEEERPNTPQNIPSFGDRFLIGDAVEPKKTTEERDVEEAHAAFQRVQALVGDDLEKTKAAEQLMNLLPETLSKPAEAKPAAKKDLEQLREEALNYADKGEKLNNPGLKMIALKRLKAIAGTKWGEQDWKTQYRFAKLAYEFMYIEEAFPAARKAVELASNNKEKTKSKAFLDGELNKRYGSVKLCRSPGSKLETGLIKPVPETPLINKEKKAIFADVVKRLEKREFSLPLYDDCMSGKAQPLTIYLPDGSFYIGTSDAIKIKVGEELPVQKVVLQLPETDNTGTYAGIVLVAGILAAIGIGIASGLNGEEQGVKLVK